MRKGSDREFKNCPYNQQDNRNVATEMDVTSLKLNFFLQIIQGDRTNDTVTLVKLLFWCKWVWRKFENQKKSSLND